MSLAKICWLYENRKDIYDRVDSFLELPDFLVSQCTKDKKLRGINSLVCKWGYDPVSQSWPKDLWSTIIHDEGLYNKIGDGTGLLAPGAAITGGLSSKGALELSLCPGTACVAGIIDAYAGAVGTLGSGLQNQGPEEVESRMAIIAGTSSCHILLRKDPIYCPGIWGPYEGAILEGFSCLEGGQTLTGRAIDLLLPLHPRYSEILNLSKSLSIFEVLNELLGNREEEFLLKGKNLHINPDIHGNRAPLADPSIRGMISGWSMDFLSNLC